MKISMDAVQALSTKLHREQKVINKKYGETVLYVYKYFCPLPVSIGPRGAASVFSNFLDRIILEKLDGLHS